jgi:hypothetical protein
VTAPASKLLPFFTVCPTCEARRYDEGNRRHVTVLIDDATLEVAEGETVDGPRYVCLDVVVPPETKAEDMDRVLDAMCARLTGKKTDGGVHFVRAS